jgi:hypothetical protein
VKRKQKKTADKSPKGFGAKPLPAHFFFFLFSRAKKMNTSHPLVDELPKVVARFQRGEGKRVGALAQHITTADGTHYFGVHRASQHRLDDETSPSPCSHDTLKAAVARAVDLGDGTRIAQVIGDSRPFGRDGTRRALRFLREALVGCQIVLYGYTAYPVQGGRCCVNAATEALLFEKRLPASETEVEQEGEEETQRTAEQTPSSRPVAVGSLVAFHTREALSRWGCTGPALRCYVVVYGDDETSEATGTLFGDDIATSDGMADLFVLLEGGVQSFAQVCNALLLGRPVLAVGGLRDEDEAKKDEGALFSATEFLRSLRDRAEGVTLEDCRVDHFRSRRLADPARRDYGTKRRLMDAAWQNFVVNRLDERLHLVSFEPPDEPK